MSNGINWENPSLYDYTNSPNWMNFSTRSNNYMQPYVSDDTLNSWGLYRNNNSINRLNPLVSYDQYMNGLAGSPTTASEPELTGIEKYFGKNMAPWMMGGQLLMNGLSLGKGVWDMLNANREYKQGLRAYNLMEKKLNRDIYNQAQSINNVLGAGASTAAAAGGAHFKNGKIVGANDTTKGLYMDRYEKRKMNGNPL